MGGPFALTQNLLCALAKLKEHGRCQAFGSFHYHGDSVPDADNLLEQIRWFREAGFDGIKMLDGKPGVRLRQNLPLDAENYDKMFAYAERTQFPILYHINDPIEFWYRDRLPRLGGGEGLFTTAGETIRISLKSIRRRSASCISTRTSTSASRTFSLSPTSPASAAKLLDRYPNLYFDITPGWEMFENFAKDIEFWRAFFGKYSNKILFGTDTFSDHWARDRLLPEKGNGDARALYRL